MGSGCGTRVRWKVLLYLGQVHDSDSQGGGVRENYIHTTGVAVNRLVTEEQMNTGRRPTDMVKSEEHR